MTYVYKVFQHSRSNRWDIVPWTKRRQQLNVNNGISLSAYCLAVYMSFSFTKNNIFLNTQPNVKKRK